MSLRQLKLTSGQNIWLATVSSRLATLCGSYLFDRSRATGEDEIVIQKGREYFKHVKTGLEFQKNKLPGFSFDPETLHSINALYEVFLVSQNIDEVLDNVEKTFETIEGKASVEDEIIEKTFDFFTALAEKVRKSSYNPEASHTL